MNLSLLVILISIYIASFNCLPFISMANIKVGSFQRCKNSVCDVEIKRMVKVENECTIRNNENAFMFLNNGVIDVGVFNTIDDTLTDSKCEFIDLEQFHKILFHAQKATGIKLTDFYNDGADYVLLGIIGFCNSIIGYLSYLICRGKKYNCLPKRQFNKEPVQPVTLDNADTYNNLYTLPYSVDLYHR